MPLVISDDQLKAAGLSPEDARVELACRLFQAGKLHLWPAAQLAELSRVEMEDALRERGIPAYVLTEEDLEQDLETLRRVRSRS
jgi:predicted HTH domain antitoxin